MIGALCLLLAFAMPAAAQEATPATPTLAVDFDETEAIPGQSLSLRLTVLAPTFMPKPPVWPTFEMPNLLVRVASTGPTSQRIGGATWAGISRRYLIAPMVPGDFTLPAAALTLTYADPDTNAPRTVTLDTEPLHLTGIVPAGAEGLDPFIAAETLQLEQTVDGTPGAMKPGDSATRTVTARIGGTSPMFLPDLIPPLTIPGVRAYPDEPLVEETSERGKVAGTRTERVTLLAEGGGEGAAPELALDWYNLRTGKVETASVEGFAVAVDGPPVNRSEPRDWRALILAAAAALLALTLVAYGVRCLLPPLRRLVAARRAARRASEAYAFAALMRIVRGREHARLRPALDAWAARAEQVDPRQDPRIGAALTAIGAARYRAGGGDEGEGWRRLAHVLPVVRREAPATDRRRGGRVLPPLNPGTA